MAKSFSPKSKPSAKSSSEIEWSEINIKDKPDLLHLLREEAITRNQNFNPDDPCEGNNKVFCHPIVLAAYSGRAQRVSSIDSRFVEDTFKNVPAKDVAHIVEWMYNSGRNVSRIVDSESLPSLYDAALKMDITDLLKQLNEIIKYQSDAVHLLPLIKVLQANNCKAMLRYTLEKVCDQAYRLLNTEDFVRLDVDDAVMIWSQDGLAIQNEMEVFLSAVLWLNEQWSSRKANTVKVMECVRFTYINLEQLFSFKRNYEILLKCEPVEKMVQNAIHFKVFNRKHAMDSREMKEFLKVSGMRLPPARSNVLQLTEEVTCTEDEVSSHWSDSTLCSPATL